MFEYHIASAGSSNLLSSLLHVNNAHTLGQPCQTEKVIIHTRCPSYIVQGLNANAFSCFTAREVRTPATLVVFFTDQLEVERWVILF